MSRRILVADSDEKVCDGLRTLLSGAGYLTFFAADGISLIEQARKHQPQLIMVNFSIPAGNALLLVQALRRFPEFTHTPIFIFADRDLRTSASQVFDAGANAFLPKPFNRQVLFSLIARFLPSEASRNVIDPSQIADSRQEQPAGLNRFSRW